MTACTVDEMTHGNFANLLIGGLNVLIPQNDIYALEPVLDVRIASDDSWVVGEFERNNSVWKLYALSKNLTLLTSCPNNYRIAVLLKNVDIACGLLCEQVQTISRDEIVIYPVPAIMNSSQLPLLALARYGEQVRCISNAQLLSSLFLIGAQR